MAKKSKESWNSFVEQAARYLPKPLKDFHDQKSIFRRISEMEQDPSYPMPGWITAQIYTIDRFLWFMASHGYTLQRSKAKVQFRSLTETMTEFRHKEIEQLKITLGFKG